jgi:hypothetical protein
MSSLSRAMERYASKFDGISGALCESESACPRNPGIRSSFFEYSFGRLLSAHLRESDWLVKPAGPARVEIPIGLQSSVRAARH